MSIKYSQTKHNHYFIQLPIHYYPIEKVFDVSRILIDLSNVLGFQSKGYRGNSYFISLLFYDY